MLSTLFKLLLLFACCVIPPAISSSACTPEPCNNCTKPNTIWKTCQSSTQPTCQNPKPTITTDDCGNGCFCMDGYVLNSNNDCVKLADCPPTPVCPKNQTYSQYAQVCRKNCETQYLNLMYMCQAKPGCDCNPGYIDNKQGNCILPEDCDPRVVKCPTNKEYDKCRSKVETCQGVRVYKKCAIGCFCKKEFVLNDQEECVPRDKCPSVKPAPPVCTKANTEWQECQSSTRPTCEDPEPVVQLLDCINDCFCKPGYVLDGNNNCVKLADCPPKCTANETYTESAPICRDNCANQYLNADHSCGAQPGCACNPGYVDDTKGKCILSEDCDPKLVICPKNKQYSNCQGSEETCTGTRLFIRCATGCFCKPGLVLNEVNNECVRKDKCPQPECPKNETYSQCGGACGRTCANYYLNIFFKCACIPGCGCKDGYIRNAEERCVRVKDCTEAETNCGENQHFGSGEVRKTCARPHGDGHKTTGCFCDTGLVYDDDQRRCIDPRECAGSKQNRDCEARDANSEFKTCQPGTVLTCNGSYVNTDVCRPACYCKPGYYLDSKQKCVVDCNNDCPPNSTYSGCAGVCRTSCSDMLRTDLMCPLFCRAGCACNDGYVHNNNGECILKTDCNPKEIQCPNRLTFHNCKRSKQKVCIGQSQEATVSKECQWGCFCDDPFVLDKDNNQCVYPEECAKSEENMKCEKSDPNSQYRVGVSSTRRTCTNPDPVAYTKDFRSGCFCKDGYYYEEGSKKCLSYGDCPK